MKSYIKILFLLVITLVILSLASCGNNEIDLPDDNEESTEATTAEENEVNGSEASTCNHEYEEKILVAATCQKEGISKKTCKLCKTTENGTVPKALHVEVIDPAIAATCTEPGKTEGAHCMNCNTVLRERETVEPLGHTEIIDEAIAATCTTPGKTEGKHCSVCNEVTLAQETVNALGHTEVIDEARAATCITTGLTEGKHCSVCNEVLVLQKHIDVLGHSTVKRTHTPVTCQANGIVEIYCTRCETVQNYETILKGHYPADHEYAQITHESIGNLCIGYKHGDKCELCNTRFIAPGKYTLIGTLTSSKDWIGKERFSFDYEKADKVYNAHSFDIIKSEDEYSNYSIEIDGETMEAFNSLVITVTEEYFAEVSDEFYNKVFLKYFEKGEYAISGKYKWQNYLTHFIDIEQDINFTYTPKNSKSVNGTKIMVIKNVDEIDVLKSIIRYDTYYNPAISFESDPNTEWIYNVEREIDFGETSQTVSKEFFEWFTSVAEKQVD